MIGRFFAGIYRWLAISGLIMKDDEPLEVRDPNREWGPSVDGLQLSAKANGERLSVVIRNTGTDEIRAKTPGWLFFYRLEITPAAKLTRFGKHALDPARNDRNTEIVLTAGKPIEAELPIDSLYEISNGTYRIVASCEVAGRKLQSNAVEMKA